MLGDCELMAFVATTQPEKAKAFYSGTLGLKLIGDAPFALVFSSGGITLRVQKVQAFSPHQSRPWDGRSPTSRRPPLNSRRKASVSSAIKAWGRMPPESGPLRAAEKSAGSKIPTGILSR
jgi:catechol 2,3-dioxygenase-like lactoylglutathione lyase family enzyme